LTGCAPFIVAAGNLFLAIAPLAAQTEAVPDPSAPPADTPPLPAATVQATPAATPAQATPLSQQVSAATVVSDSSQAANGGVLTSGVGPTPQAGPGAAPQSDLGSQISSAALSRKLPFRVTATLGEVYNNNIFYQTQKQGDFITRLAVRGEYQVGDLTATDGNYFDLVYSPGLHIYERHSHETGVDQYADALYGHHWTKLTLTLEQSYRKTQETDASVGGLVTANAYQTILMAKYIYSPSVDVIATAKQQFTNYDQPDYSDSKEWSGTIYALYHIDPKLSVGFGPRIGYLNIDRAPDETYQQFLARLLYDPSSKMHFEGAVGVEDRQYQSVGRKDTIEPVFEMSGSYLPDPSTVIILSSSRQFQPAYNFIGQDYIATNVNLTATQRFFDAYYLGVAAGFENDDYQNVSYEPGPTREDNYFYVQPSLTWKANGWLKVAAFDRYAEDSSNFDIFTYDSNQVGVSISATY
jgi:hypothetical protein